jgi:hypothetical protein
MLTLGLRGAMKEIKTRSKIIIWKMRMNHKTILTCRKGHQRRRKIKEDLKGRDRRSKKAVTCISLSKKSMKWNTKEGRCKRMRKLSREGRERQLGERSS